MKRFLKFLSFTCFILLLLTLPLLLGAQDSTDSTGGGGGTGISLSPTLVTILLVVLSLYEIFIRYYPTAQNWSILGLLIKIIQFVLPNRATPAKKQAVAAKMVEAAKTPEVRKPDTPPALP